MSDLDEAVLDPSCGYSWTDPRRPCDLRAIVEENAVQHECIRASDHKRFGMHVCACGAVTSHG